MGTREKRTGRSRRSPPRSTAGINKRRRSSGSSLSSLGNSSQKQPQSGRSWESGQPRNTNAFCKQWLDILAAGRRSQSAWEGAHQSRYGHTGNSRAFQRQSVRRSSLVVAVPSAQPTACMARCLGRWEIKGCRAALVATLRNAGAVLAGLHHQDHQHQLGSRHRWNCIKAFKHNRCQSQSPAPAILSRADLACFRPPFRSN